MDNSNNLAEELPSSSTSPLPVNNGGQRRDKNAHRLRPSHSTCGIANPVVSSSSPLSPLVFKSSQERNPGEQARRKMLELLTSLSQIKSHEQSAQQPISGQMIRCSTCNGFGQKRNTSQVESNCSVGSSDSPHIEINGFKIPNEFWSQPFKSKSDSTTTTRLLHIALRPNATANGTGKKLKLDLSLVPNEDESKT